MPDDGTREALTTDITYRPIGVIRTPFTDVAGMPVQSAGAIGIGGRIELDPSLVEGLVDLDGMSHIILLYHLDRVGPVKLTVRSFFDDALHGVFATRSPARPVAIGLSVVRLVAMDGPTLEIEDVDMLDGTPLLDIKPYVPALDDRQGARIGWYEGRVGDPSAVRSDDRFSGPR